MGGAGPCLVLEGNLASRELLDFKSFQMPFWETIIIDN